MTFLPPEIMSNVPQFLLLGGLSVALVSMAKAGFGGGVGLLSVPLMFYACPGHSKLALGITLPLLIINDYIALAAWWRKWDWRSVLLLLPGSVLGIGAGWVTLWSFQRIQAAGGNAHQEDLSNAAFTAAVGLIAIGFVILHFIRSRRAEPWHFRPVLWQGSAFGAVAGYTSTLAHAAGPVINVYMLPQKMSKDVFVGSTLLYFWIGNQLKVVPYYCLGMLSPSALGGVIVFLPAVALGTVLGILLHRRVNQTYFTIIVHTLLFLTGVQMLISATQKILAVYHPS